jgi:hypothetical protein
MQKCQWTDQLEEDMSSYIRAHLQMLYVLDLQVLLLYGQRITDKYLHGPKYTTFKSRREIFNTRTKDTRTHNPNVPGQENI